MPTDVNRIAQGLAAAWSSVDAEKIVSFFADDCVFEDVCVGYVCHGKEELKNRANAIFAKVLDLKLEIKSLFANGEWIGCEWIETGTQTGKRFSVRGASIVQLRDGKIIRESIYCHFDGATWFDD
ncbi:hypothetical protein AMJ87_13920 [candidate division WOR_3 bacterium SM23_60]|uniref:SnoaL-like domain-containing protein n=1 Tax=candidate division WOR_3 bacterium SM23_60 TaxID=1703780 RepID=A0A0S8G2Q4_UNCW3|nr:MAG: hypothetical protein AMJ87_13920 [candidate division WOR_3 bacterium SM23_60]